MALASAWRREGGEVHYVAAAPLATQAETWIRSAGLALDVIDAARYSDADAETTARIAAGVPVVLDAFGTPLRYRSALRRGCRRLTIIDDTGGGGPWSADIVVNQNYGAEAGMYPGREPATALLLGPRHALLRPEFARWRDRPRRRDGVATRIVASFGGADPKDTTSVALAALASLPASGRRALLVAGAANPRAAILKARASASGWPMRVLRRPSSMARVFAWADLAVLAGGASIWEALCLGVPAIGIAIADNQVPAAEALGRDGLWHYLGRAEDVTEAQIAEAVARLLGDPAECRRLSEAGRAAVDGKGADRVAQALERLPA